MTKERALLEIKRRNHFENIGFWLILASIIFMAAGLLGFAVFFDFYIIDSILFTAGAIVLIFTAAAERKAKKQSEKIFTDNFILPEIERHFTEAKAENTLPITKNEIEKLGFFKNLKWTDIDGRRFFSSKFQDRKVKFCELGIYNLFSVSSKGHGEKVVTEKDYIFRGRYFDIEISLTEDEARKTIIKTERYNLCNKGSVRTEYINGHLYIFHNINGDGEKFEHWLPFPEETNLDAETIENKIRSDFEPYATLLSHIL